jgi:hypothetical protein
MQAHAHTSPCEVSLCHHLIVNKMEQVNKRQLNSTISNFIKFHSAVLELFFGKRWAQQHTQCFTSMPLQL